MTFNKNQTLPHYCLIQEICLAMNLGEVYYFPPLWVVCVLKMKGESTDDLFRSVVLEL